MCEGAGKSLEVVVQLRLQLAESRQQIGILCLQSVVFGLLKLVHSLLRSAFIVSNPLPIQAANKCSRVFLSHTRGKSKCRRSPASPPAPYVSSSCPSIRCWFRSRC